MIKKLITNMSPREKKLLSFAGIVLLLFLCERLLVGPALSKVQALDSEIATEMESIKRDLQFYNSRDMVEEQTDSYGKFLTTESTTEDEVIAAFLKELELIATDADINLAKVSPAGHDYQDDHLKYFATLECSGDFTKVIDFIHRIDTSHSLLSVTKYDIKAKRTDPTQVKVAMGVAKMIVSADPTIEPKQLVQLNEDPSDEESEEESDEE